MTTIPAGGLTAGAVARRLGVAVTTLRTWHQRYGLGPSLHEPGHHRRYTAEDIARLELMQRLVGDGVPPGEAARWAARTSVVPGSLQRHRRLGMDPNRELYHPVEVPPGSAPAARGLTRAVMRLDAPAVRHRVADAVAELGVIEAWNTVLRPVLVTLGDRHAATGSYVEVEHLLSVCISAVFGAVPRPPADVPARILLSCADEEQHSLPIEALAAALAADGVPCRMLGSRVPPAALGAAIRRTGPTAVLIWSHHTGTADLAALRDITLMPGRPMLIAAAGPGWDAVTLPDGVVSPRGLADAVALLSAAV